MDHADDHESGDGRNGATSTSEGQERQMATGDWGDTKRRRGTRDNDDNGAEQRRQGGETRQEGGDDDNLNDNWEDENKDGNDNDNKDGGDRRVRKAMTGTPTKRWGNDNDGGRRDGGNEIHRDDTGPGGTEFVSLILTN
jgi:transcription termination factor Rho